MTDSESDLSNPNVFTFQNANTTVSARGPNSNINLSFPNNPLTSTMYMPQNFERQRYAESVSDQRSIYYRRETSPMSIRSACDIQPRNFQYYSGMGSHQSVYNGRSGSPVSMRSIDSSASVSAAVIAFALKNVKYNKYDWRVIDEAYNQLMKQRFRKRKRRNLRLILKGTRHRSEDDSGEHGSDSSISSDDCRSTKTSLKENVSFSGSARMKLTDFRKTVRENNVFKDYSESLKQNNFKNMFSVTTSSNRSHNFNSSSFSKQTNCHSIPTLKDRFKNGFLLPSQRFNRSVASSVRHENSEKQHRNIKTYRRNDNINFGSNEQPENKNCECGSEEGIFSGVSFREKITKNTQRESASKRGHESDDDSSLPQKKKSKIDSPVKNAQSNRKVPSKVKNSNLVNNNNNEINDNFEFAKPSLPVRKSKSKVQETVIAKSKQPLTGFVEPMPAIINNVETVQATVQEKPKDSISQDDHLESTQNSDVSLRPSFIKRKLFTQKLDVAEKTNLSSDGLNSPQNVYSAIQKEKNKARKLVTSQSCLNREVQEDNNLLDLIHKIVPADRMNLTNHTTINQTKTDANNSNKKDDEDKWDVTSVISMCNENDVSDTFTDEEIFGSDNKSKGAKISKEDCSNTDLKSNVSTKTKPSEERNNEIQKECRIVVENIDFKKVIQKPVEKESSNLTICTVNKSTIKSSTKTFWDTDFESDAECQLTTQKIFITDTNQTKDVNKSTIKSSAKTFWDTDFESDAECQLTTQKSFIKDTNQTKENVVPETSAQGFKQPLALVRSSVSKPYSQVLETSRWLNKTKNDSIMNSTLDSTRKFNISTLSVRSHRTMKKKKCCNEICFQEIASTKSVTNKKSALKPVISSSQPEIKITNSTTKPADTDNTITKPESVNKTTSKSTVKTKTTSKSEGKRKTASKSEEKGKAMSKSEVKGNTTSKSEVKEKTTTKSEEKSKATPKPEMNTTQTETSPKTNMLAKNKKTSEKPIRTPTKNTKPKTITQKANRSTSRTRQKSKEPKYNSDKQTQSAKNISNDVCNGRPIRSCRTPSQNRSTENSRSSRQFEISPLNIVATRLTRRNNFFNDDSLQDITPIKTGNNIMQMTKTKASSELNKTLDSRNQKPDVQNKISNKKAPNNNNKSISTLRSNKSPKVKSKTSKQMPKNITSHQTPKCDRPIRSCRTPGQNRSIENYKSSIRGR